jgi:ABC-2 type transport system ATP-binding protein
MFEWMTVGRMIRWSGRFYPNWSLDAAERTREALSLSDGARVGALTAEASVRLAFVLATAHQPTLVILDGPNTGLDPIARRRLLTDLTSCMNEKKITALIAMDHPYELASAATHASVIRGGTIIMAGACTDLVKSVEGADGGIRESTGDAPRGDSNALSAIYESVMARMPADAT